MAENTNYIGVAMGLDVTDLKAGLSEANKQIQLANSKFKAASSGMDDWTKSTEGLTAKVEQLDTVLKLQKSKLAGLEAEYAKVAKEQGENSEAARKLQVQIYNQQAVVNKTEKEFDAYSETLEDVKKGVVDLEKVSIRGGKAVEKAGEQAEEAGDGFTIAKGAVAGFIANGLTKLVSVAGNAIKSILGLSDSTRELRENMNKLETAFESAGHSTEQAEKTYTDLYSILGDEGAATEAAQQLAKISKTEKDLATNTRILTGVMAEYGNSIPTEGLAEGMAATAAMGTVQGTLADALEWQGVNLDEYNEKLGTMSTEEQRSAYIQKTLLDLYGESATAYEEKNKSVIEAREAEAQLAQTTAELGEIAEPIMTSVKQGFAEILKAILELIDGADFEAIKAGIGEAFQTFIDDILPAIVDGFQWIIDNKDVLIAGIAGIGAAMLTMNVANMIMGVVNAFKAFKAAQEGATIAQWLLNVAMNANPIGLIVAAIAGLVTAFVLLWQKSEAFRNFWIGLWEGLKKAVGVVVDWIKENWQAMLLFLVNPLAGVFKYLYDNFEGFRNFVDGVVESVKKFFSDMWSGVKKGASDAWNGIKSVFSKVGSFFSDTFTKAWTKVKNIFSTGGKIFSGIKDGIVSAFKKIVNAIIRGINKVISVPFNAINKVLDKIRGISIAGVSPFKGLFGDISVPSIPELVKGGILKKGQVGLLEGKGAERILPLEEETGWIKKIAAQLAKDIAHVKGNAAGIAYSGAGRGNAGAYGATTISAPLTVNYNGKLSRKELKKTENNHYKALRMRLKAEGAI